MKKNINHKRMGEAQKEEKMTNRKFNKRWLVITMALVMLFSFAMPGIANMEAKAAGPLAMLTFDADKFTIVENAQQTIEITAKGLDAAYQPTTVDPAKVTWASDNTAVASVTWATVGGNSVATVTLNAEGNAKITASYTDAGVQPVHSTVWVEGAQQNPVTNITVTVKNGNQTLLNVTGLTVNIGEISGDIVVNLDGTVAGVPVSGALKNSPTALGALVQSNPTGLQIFTTGFVNKMYNLTGAQVNGVWNGWQYKVNGVSPDFGAGVYKLNNNDSVEFFYGPISF